MIFTLSKKKNKKVVSIHLSLVTLSNSFSLSQTHIHFVILYTSELQYSSLCNKRYKNKSFRHSRTFVLTRQSTKQLRKKC